MSITIDISANDLDNLAFCAFRYALGRQTYIVGIVAETLGEYLEWLSESSRVLMAREIREAIEKGHAGREGDTRSWHNLLKDIEAITPGVEVTS